MKFKENSVATRGMIFAGCSFTWGQGLYYYSHLPSLKEPPPNNYFPHFVKWSHYEYMKTVRFPRLVASHFDTFELCQPWNGGAPNTVNKWWRERFKHSSDSFEEWPHTSGPTKSIVEWNDASFKNQLYDYQDFSYIIYQFTQWGRNPSYYKVDKNGDPINSHGEVMGSQEFRDWLITQNMTIDEYTHNAKEQIITDTVDLLQTFESNGVKVYVMVWPDELIDYVKNNTWLNDRLIEFNYKNEHYSNIYELMRCNDELKIDSDYDSFEEPPKDHHPSLLCHKVMADHIIKRIERDYE